MLYYNQPSGVLGMMHPSTVPMRIFVCKLMLLNIYTYRVAFKFFPKLD